MHDPSDRDFERMFALDDAAGPARPVDDARAAAIISGALGGAGFPPPGGTGGAGGAGGKPVAASSAVKGVAATKLALLAGGAVTAIAAVAWLAVRTPHEPPARTAATTAQLDTRGSAASVGAPAMNVASDTTLPTTLPTSPTASADHAIEANAADPAAANQADATAEPVAATDLATVEPATGPAHHPPAKPGSHRKPHAPRAEPATVAVAPEARAPDDLLAEANAARATHRWRDADALYARVVGGPHTDLAGQTALVASASIHLEHLGDAAGAARRFRAALAAAPRDTLAEDARWGLVEAARALGDATGELHALDDFLAHHASSALAPRARTRRVELGATP